MPPRKKTPEKPVAVLLITNCTWKEIREQFSEIEKEALRKTITNEVLCPPGVYLDRNRLAAPLAEKLRQALVTQAELLSAKLAERRKRT